MLLLVGCEPAPVETARDLLLEIHSSFQLPDEANELWVQVESDGAVVAQELYPLGAPPRDRWPQTLPIYGGEHHADTVDVALDLRLRLAEDEPPVLRGQVAQRIAFPAEGTRTVAMEIPRGCEDADGDRYGEGMGCRGADCDDGDAALNTYCPAPVVDCSSDASLCDAETELCHAQVCLPRCDPLAWWDDCGRKEYLTCLADPGVCVCRTPCDDDEGCEICSSWDWMCAFPEQWSCTDGCCVP